MLNESGLWKRAALIQARRNFFIDRGYIEVETPLRLPVLIPEAHNEPVESGDHFLQNSPEICMKRLLAETGCQKIFQICKCFRKNERGDRHLPELTMLEWYRTRCDYLSLMDESEDMVIEVARASGHSGPLFVRGKNINLEKPLSRRTVADAFAQYAERMRIDPGSGKRNYAVVQAEDDLAAMGMVIGASWNGARAFTATSG